MPDPELRALLDQAERNLKTLELLLGSLEPPPDRLRRLQEQIRRLKRAYVHETDALTREVLKRAVERRSGDERRKDPEPRPVGT